MATLQANSHQHDAEINILLIEDDEADIFLFEDIVKQNFPKCTIQTASDGQQAIDVMDVHKFSPDVIFLDINMPRMNGHEFLAAYGSTISDKAIPVYVLTSSDIKKGRDRVLFSPYQCIMNCCMKSAGLDQVIAALNQCAFRGLKLVAQSNDKK